MPELPSRDLEEAVERVGPSWDELRGSHVLFTGGTGFIGRWLIETLMWADTRFRLGTSAVVLTREPERFRRAAPHLVSHPGIRCHAGDVRSFDFPPGSFSHVVHGAANGSWWSAGDALEMVDTIVGGTRRVLDLCASAHCRKLLFLSSGAVYGAQPEGIPFLTERHCGAPLTSHPGSPYGESKRFAELLCALFGRRHGIEAKIARCFAFIGPLLPINAGFAAGNFIADVLDGRPIQVRGDGRAVRSYLYAADLAAWLWTILFRGAPGEIYNVGSDEEVTIRELAERIASTREPPAPVRIATPASAGLAERYVPSIEKARTTLGLAPVVPLQEAIHRTLAFHRAGV